MTVRTPFFNSALIFLPLSRSRYVLGPGPGNEISNTHRCLHLVVAADAIRDERGCARARWVEKSAVAYAACFCPIALCSLLAVIEI